MDTKFGNRIKELRTAKGLTLDKLAELTGSSKSYVWELENKNPPRPSADKLSSIAQALGVTVDYLYGRDEQTFTEAEDKVFFREYAGLDEDTKKAIRNLAKSLGKNDARK
jgi:transcriptional regulator with XRE-family HTH domain